MSKKKIREDTCVKLIPLQLKHNLVICTLLVCICLSLIFNLMALFVFIPYLPLSLVYSPRRMKETFFGCVIGIPKNIAYRYFKNIKPMILFCVFVCMFVVQYTNVTNRCICYGSISLIFLLQSYNWEENLNF